MYMCSAVADFMREGGHVEFSAQELSPPCPWDLTRCMNIVFAKSSRLVSRVSKFSSCKQDGSTL